jgi:hypothetical protein
MTKDRAAKRFRHFFTSLTVSFVLTFAAVLSAATNQDFDILGSPYTLGQWGVAPAPTIESGGPTGNFLRLVTTSVPNVNTITFDLTDLGPSEEITVDFDFRMTPGFLQADGFGFALLNTDNFGATGGVGGNSEEANYPGSLGVGFDIHQGPGEINNNHVSIHFNGTKLAEVDASPVTNLAGSQFIHARIVMRPGNGISDVSVILTPPGGSAVTLIDQFPVPGFEPYEGRAHFGARSGGQSADHDLDNILIQFSQDPAVFGQWSDVIEAQVVPVHLHLLPTGKVLYWQNGGQSDQVRLWDPMTETIGTPALPGYDTFCTGHSFMADGRLLVTGGHESDFEGLPNASLYDSFTDSWTPLPPMNEGRWYPTNTTLANGSVLVLGGDIMQGVVNPLPQIWQSDSGTWRNLTNVQDVPLGVDDDGIYPRQFLIPDGRVFKVGPQKETVYLDTIGLGAWVYGPSSNFGTRSYGSSVLYDAGKILIVGGGEFPPTATSEVINLNDAVPAWRFVDSMAFARRHLNATLLPDGNVLVTGGTSSPGFNDAAKAVHAAEIWDSQAETWLPMAAMHLPRVYHSTAILLQDGRVLVGGGGRPAPTGHIDNTNFEIYSPPYLFRGARPSIAAAPEVIIYGQAFTVQTPEASSIESVNFLRLPSATHAFDQNQRMVRLSFSQTSNELNVTAPVDPNLAPPGHYMLFILTDAGVPSVASILHVSLCLGDSETGDSDGDGVCNDIDLCPGSDDSADADGDGVPNGCDLCPGSDDSADADGDGVPNGCDLCPGSDDSADADGDGVPNGCDLCLGDDATGDSDSDAVCADIDCDDADPSSAFLDACGVCGGDNSSCSRIFEDGFESGDTSSWSLTVP